MREAFSHPTLHPSCLYPSIQAMAKSSCETIHAPSPRRTDKGTVSDTMRAYPRL